MTEEHQPYPQDAQTQRTRWELWAIVIIVAAVIVGSLAWRVIGHHPAGKEIPWGAGANGGAGPNGANGGNMGAAAVPAAAAAHPAAPRAAP